MDIEVEMKMEIEKREKHRWVRGKERKKEGEN